MKIEYRDGKLTVKSEEESGKLDNADKLINLLIEKTENDEIEWRKYDNRNNYFYADIKHGVPTGIIRIRISDEFFYREIFEPFRHPVPKKLIEAIHNWLRKKEKQDKENKKSRSIAKILEGLKSTPAR